MWENRCKVAVSGVGFSKVYRSAEIPLANLALDAVKAAVEDSGLKISDIDGLSAFSALSASGHDVVDGIAIVSVDYLRRMLKLPTINWLVQVQTAAEGGAVMQAANALLAGICKYVVVWQAVHVPPGSYKNLPGAYASGEAQFTGPYGFGGAGEPRHAMAYMRYLEQHNQKKEKTATLVVTERKHGNKNPNAYFYKTTLSREEYLNARMISSPLCLYDYDIPVQQACALVLTTAERARDLKPKPAYLAGYGQRTVFEEPGRFLYSVPGMADYMDFGRSSSSLTWERSGFTPKDVDVAQIGDNLSSTCIYGIESYGFCGRGEALDFIQDGRIDLDGELPLNTFGGAASVGRIHGTAHIIEGVLQAQGRAGERQVKNAKVSFATGGGAIAAATTFIFVGDPY